LYLNVFKQEKIRIDNFELFSMTELFEFGLVRGDVADIRRLCSIKRGAISGLNVNNKKNEENIMVDSTNKFNISKPVKLSGNICNEHLNKEKISETYGGNAVGPNSYIKNNENSHQRSTLFATRKNQSKLTFFFHLNDSSI
jgi:hypothetical protein